jgi:hypothetical protein
MSEEADGRDVAHERIAIRLIELPPLVGNASTVHLSGIDRRPEVNRSDNQSLPHAIEDDFDAVMEVEFAHESFAMRLDRIE